ncbi:MAG TPA: universal stress protein [Gammaproteobacteria bacterium]
MAARDRLLVIVDPTSESQPAVERAIWLAKTLEAGIELYVCDYDQVLLSDQSFSSDDVERAKRRVVERNLQKLRGLARRVAAEGVEVEIDVRWHHPLDEGLICKTHESKPAVVIKETHYHSLLKRSIFSNTDWELIRGCPAALLLVKPGSFPDHPRIVAAVDPLHAHDKPAELDRAILAVAQNLSRRSKGDLHVFHAFDPAPAIAVAADAMMTPLSTPVSVATEALETRHRDALRELLERCAIDDAQTHIHQGLAQELLIRLTEQIEANLVVMGAASRSAVKRLFVGSTAERVLDKLPCDVLIVKVGENVRRFVEDFCAGSETVSP